MTILFIFHWDNLKLFADQFLDIVKFQLNLLFLFFDNFISKDILIILIKYIIYFIFNINFIFGDIVLHFFFHLNSRLWPLHS